MRAPSAGRRKSIAPLSASAFVRQRCPMQQAANHSIVHRDLLGDNVSQLLAISLISTLDSGLMTPGHSAATWSALS